MPEITKEQRVQARLKLAASMDGRRRTARAAMGYLPLAVDFATVSRNLKNDRSFFIWIEKMMSIDKGLTVRYMTKNHANFDMDKINRYNDLLRANRLEKYQIPVGMGTND